MAMETRHRRLRRGNPEEIRQLIAGRIGTFKSDNEGGTLLFGQRDGGVYRSGVSPVCF